MGSKANFGKPDELTSIKDNFDTDVKNVSEPIEAHMVNADFKEGESWTRKFFRDKASDYEMADHFYKNGMYSKEEYISKLDAIENKYSNTSDHWTSAVRNDLEKGNKVEKDPNEGRLHPFLEETSVPPVTPPAIPKEAINIGAQNENDVMVKIATMIQGLEGNVHLLKPFRDAVASGEKFGILNPEQRVQAVALIDSMLTSPSAITNAEEYIGKLQLQTKQMKAASQQIAELQNKVFELKEAGEYEKAELITQELQNYREQSQGIEIDDEIPILTDPTREPNAKGGRVGLEGGGNPLDKMKMNRRGFMGLGLGAIAALLSKGKGVTSMAPKVAEVAATNAIPLVEGMPRWFPLLVNKIKDTGKVTRKSEHKEITDENINIVEYKLTDDSLAGGSIHMIENLITGEVSIWGRGDDYQQVDLTFTPGERTVDVKTGNRREGPPSFDAESSLGLRGLQNTPPSVTQLDKHPVAIKEGNRFEASEFAKGETHDIENYGTIDDLRGSLETWESLAGKSNKITKEDVDAEIKKFMETYKGPEEPNMAKGGRVGYATGGGIGNLMSAVNTQNGISPVTAWGEGNTRPDFDILGDNQMTNKYGDIGFSLKTPGGFLPAPAPGGGGFGPNGDMLGGNTIGQLPSFGPKWQLPPNPYQETQPIGGQLPGGHLPPQQLPGTFGPPQQQQSPWEQGFQDLQQEVNQLGSEHDNITSLLEGQGTASDRQKNFGRTIGDIGDDFSPYFGGTPPPSISDLNKLFGSNNGGLKGILELDNPALTTSQPFQPGSMNQAAQSMNFNQPTNLEAPNITHQQAFNIPQNQGMTQNYNAFGSGAQRGQFNGYNQGGLTHTVPPQRGPLANGIGTRFKERQAWQ